MAAMLAADSDSLTSLGQLRKLLIGGEAVSAPLMKELAGVVAGEVHNMYGPTETTIWSTTGVFGREDTSVSIGTPIANTQVYILDRHLQPVARGMEGEVYIGGAGVARGYWNRPELTAERFILSSFTNGGSRLYRTGDVARHLSDGRIEFIGRTDQQVKLRGFRIELGEVESALCGYQSIGEAVASVRDDSSGSKTLVAYVTSKGAKPSPSELRSYLKEKLPEYMVPAFIVPMDKFPRTPNGKIDRKALPDPSVNQSEATRVYAAPKDELENRLVRLWQEVLNLEQVGIDDNFFDLGGHSLLMMKVFRKLREELSGEFSIVDMFRYTTVRTLAAFLSKKGDPSGALKQVYERAESRKEALSRREQMRRVRQQQNAR